MHVNTETFAENSAEAVKNEALQSRLRVLNGFVALRNLAFGSLPDGEALRDRARAIKEEAIAHLDHYVLQLEESVVRLGGQVHWARDGDEACSIILEIARNKEVRSVVKSKSMVTEEIELNEMLQSVDIEAIETDLGEYIVQLAREKPSHILAPAIHKSRGDVADLFVEKLGVARTSEPEELTKIARRRLREKFLSADMGITGANFAVAETGTIVLVENEGNIRLSTTLPRIHVAIMGIEKVVPRFEDIGVFLRILARSATGQKMSSYVSLITGARREGETDGAGEFHLILLDNGRTRMLANREMRESLYCLRCGACLNVCPVYQKVGGHAYGTVYSGPIGSVVTPELAGLEKANALPFASSLCGACREICPVRIDIPHLLLALRRRWSEENASRLERLAVRLWSLAMRRPVLYGVGLKLAAILAGPMSDDGWIKRLPFAPGGWTLNRDFPAPARQAFREQWRELERETLKSART
jgi:L-lactate dehydrogenase complex protein LldF